MAVHRSLVIFAIVAFMAPTISLAMDYVVGDDNGWKLEVNYTDWAKDKQFYVGDTLLFKYNNAGHNVYKVTGDDFNGCNVPSNNSLGLFTGNDKINLAAAGKKWYICGVTGHCNQGMKLKITVLDGTAPAPPPNAASTLLAKATNFQIVLGMTLSIAAALIMV
ncbi:hypothetical protein E1A91_A11G255900v1 [Gossypium mustelinum]|uniref:Phytocyanin domain-containing protein n=3 Tax=Gossypium TaxID=3633 RepID=A0A2P5WAJ9_GOSBA|nr:hypothetical protein ES319_A11G248000v1 [Gossypium barbadense]PPR88087.1 hypothetical protein GOBAR_AA32603 [Gossypium barbadense]TYG95456.1 hypothetical protein ES288_A11G269600v1 [Gossypium darwinii]TYJ11157.1 hypothetical protein E1A91_A11G255900v1 [Gossypium mustelinum]